jgi:Flp pilus assembly protein TadD
LQVNDEGQISHNPTYGAHCNQNSGGMISEVAIQAWPGVPRDYTQVLTDPEDNLLRRTLDRHRAGRLAEASRLYREILEATPDHTDVLYLLGVIAHQTGQPAQAVELMRRALAIAPDQARCYNILGLDLMALGMADEAEASFQRAIALADSPDCCNNLGILYSDQGRLELRLPDRRRYRDPA